MRYRVTGTTATTPQQVELILDTPDEHAARDVAITAGITPLHITSAPLSADTPPIILTRPAPGSVQTIQLTSRRWKGLLILAALLTSTGGLIAVAMIAQQPRLLSHPTWAVLGAASLLVAGLVLMIVARVGAWWHHG